MGADEQRVERLWRQHISSRIWHALLHGLLATAVVLAWFSAAGSSIAATSLSRDVSSDTSALDMQPRLVTSDDPPETHGHLAPGGSSILLPGMPAALNPDGVVSLVDSSAGVFCSGAVIGDRYVLTSAHCVEPASIYTPSYVSFDTASALSSGPIDDIFIHPSYDGTLESGYDIAVIQLASDAPADAPRYGLYTGTDEMGQLSVKAGHGRTGHGSTGKTAFDTKRRVGLNTYDANSTDLNAAFGMEFAANGYLLYDFDSGLAENNAWALNGVTSDLGFGVDEVNAVSGDSGGPTFIHNGTDWVIAGVTSWGAGLAGDLSDVTPGITDGSWGEISADARVSSYADFVLSVLDGTYTPPQRYAYSQGNIDPKETWNRPTADGAAVTTGDPVTYHAYSFTVDTTGQYDLESAQNFDGVVHQYQGVPDPENPLLGLIAGNDDAPEGENTSSLDNMMLSEGVTYTVVTSASMPGETGTFLNAIVGPGQVTAIPYAGNSTSGFAGEFAPVEWQFTTNHTEAHVQLDTAPDSITLFGGDDFSAGDADTTITLTQNTTLSFDWTYFSIDDPRFDLFGMLVNGEFTRLTDGEDLYGSYNITLSAGDEFGFRMHTVDGVNGAGVANIYHFDAALPGDYNGDGIVDAADYTVWRDHLGGSVVLPGDTTPGSVTAADYQVWESNFGAQTLPAGLTVLKAAVAAPTNLPEPASFYIALLAAAAILLPARPPSAK